MVITICELTKPGNTNRTTVIHTPSICLLDGKIPPSCLSTYFSEN